MEFLKKGINTSNATATANDILYPKTAYIDGKEITGQMQPEYAQDSITLNTMKKFIAPNMLDAIVEKNVYLYASSNTTLTIKSGENIKNIELAGLNTMEYILGAKFTFTPLYNNVYRIYVGGRDSIGGADTYCDVTVIDIDIDTLEIINIVNSTIPCTNMNGISGVMFYPFPNDNYMVYGVYEATNWYKTNTPGPIYAEFNEDATLKTFSFLSLAYIQYSNASANNTVDFYNNYAVIQQIGCGTSAIINALNKSLIVDNLSGTTAIIVINNIYYYYNNKALYNMENVKICDLEINEADIVYCLGRNNLLFIRTSNGYISVYEISSTFTATKLYSYNIQHSSPSSINSGMLGYVLYNSASGVIAQDTSEGDFYSMQISGEKYLLSIMRDNIKYRSPKGVTVSASNVLENKYFLNENNNLTVGTMSNNGELNYSELLEKQIIPEGYTTGGTIEAYPQTNKDYKNCLDLSIEILKNIKVLKYIQSTATQYIDTEVIPTNDTVIEMSIKKVGDIIDYERLFGILNVFEIIRAGTSNMKLKIADNEIGNISISTEAFTKLKFGQGKIIVNDIENATYSNTFDTNASAYLFYSRNADRYSIIQLEYCKIWENEILIRDFIPVKDMNGEICLFDKVNNKFYYNKGSGNFLSSEIISN